MCWEVLQAHHKIPTKEPRRALARDSARLWPSTKGRGLARDPACAPWPGPPAIPGRCENAADNLGKDHSKGCRWKRCGGLLSVAIDCPATNASAPNRFRTQRCRQHKPLGVVRSTPRCLRLGRHESSLQAILNCLGRTHGTPRISFMRTPHIANRLCRAGPGSNWMTRSESVMSSSNSAFESYSIRPSKRERPANHGQFLSTPSSLLCRLS